MLDRALTIEKLKSSERYLSDHFGVSSMLLFGSLARNEQKEDSDVDSRFQMLATCNFNSPKRTLGNWYVAKCPIVSPVGKLGPTDYFGRTMVANLPNHKIGVIAVAMGGSPIEMFDKDKYQQKYQENYNEWWAQIARNYYGENPYGRIIEMAKKAQEVGVIKGILLHQGCSNCGDPNWLSYSQQRDSCTRVCISCSRSWEQLSF